MEGSCLVLTPEENNLKLFVLGKKRMQSCQALTSMTKYQVLCSVLGDTGLRSRVKQFGNSTQSVQRQEMEVTVQLGLIREYNCLYNI